MKDLARHSTTRTASPGSLPLSIKSEARRIRGTIKAVRWFGHSRTGMVSEHLLADACLTPIPLGGLGVYASGNRFPCV